MNSFATNSEKIVPAVIFSRFGIDNGFHVPSSLAARRIWSSDPRKIRDRKRVVTSQAEFRVQGIDDASALEAMRHFEFDPARGIGFREHLARLFAYRVERKLRTVSPLDVEFFFSAHNLYGEPFRVIAKPDAPSMIHCLDINSMFAWILAVKRFPNPSKLKYDNSGGLLGHIRSGEIDNGIFRCRIAARPEHANMLDAVGPTWMAAGGTLPIRIGKDVIGRRLHAADIAGMLPYYEIEIIDGVFSDRSIEHPLAASVRAIYPLRQAGDPALRIAAKIALTTMHSCTARFREAASLVQPGGELPLRSLESSMGRYQNEIAKTKNGERLVIHYDTDNPGNLHSLTATVMAHARMRMFELLRCVWEIAPDALCYTNIDSIHLDVSVSNGVMARKALVGLVGLSGHLGELKTEAIGDSGEWGGTCAYRIQRNGLDIKTANFRKGDFTGGSLGKLRAGNGYLRYDAATGGL